MNKPESCVETPAAPEWLSKLESRREKLTRGGKLGHEAGAGAPCNECGDKCPGLDLHFWRKVCRNCKCRKDQHMCVDDDLSGWAQFEILGQIRSKPAYIKIKAFADKPVKVDWIPPNVTPDLASDYMDKLGSTHIPVAGSDAAAKRKQQLEFQVPPHDLDATLCDNLTETETAQMQQYVDKIKDHCVGQGSVVRVGNVIHGVVGKVGTKTYEIVESNAIKQNPSEILKKLNCNNPKVVKDKVIMNILNSEQLVKALLSDPARPLPSKLIAFTHPLQPDFEIPPTANLTPGNRMKLIELGLNKAMVQSLVENGPFYDSMLNNLHKKGINFSEDPILVPVNNFRVEYLNNTNFKDDMDRFVEILNKLDPQYSTPIKSKLINPDAFNSPIAARNLVQTKTGALMKQDTPMRRVKFGGISVALDLGLPIDATVERDQIFSSIINSEALQTVLQNYSKIPYKNKIIIQGTPMIPDFDDSSELSFPTRNKLEQMGLNKEAVQSGVINGPLYDKLFENLKQRGINYADCAILNPMEQFRQEFIENIPFQQEIIRFVENIPNSYNIVESKPQPGGSYISHQLSPEYGSNKSGSVSNPQSPFKSNLHGSKSSDSGFESKPPTPNYSTFPGGLFPTPATSISQQDDDPTLLGFNAHSGKFASIPGIEELNMYPQVQPSAITTAHAAEQLNDNLNNLHVSPPSSNLGRQSPVGMFKCKECAKDILSGEVAVKAERAGKDIAWHPQCFVCHNCKELLADLVYFFHHSNVYCGRDLAIILKIPRCNACDELIFTKEYTAAEGATFHIKHFCCYHCDTPLAGQQYVPDEKTNMPVCLPCYDEYYAERCQRCNTVIGPSEQGVSWKSIHWHSQCFQCAALDCGKSLLGGRFCVKNDMPFCSARCVASVIQ